MITEKADGNYLVNFPGAKAAIAVSKLSEGEKYYGSTDDRGFLYVAVLEKAYGLYLNSLQNNPTAIPSDGANFGSTDQNRTIAMRLLTGQEPITLNMSPTGLGCGKEKLASELATAFTEERVISVGLKAPPYHDRRGLRPNHSYALFLQNGKMVLRDSLKTGAKSMIETTIDDLYANFNVVRIQKRR